MTNREAFEAHMLKLNSCTRLYRQSEAAGGAYRTITVERAWQQWQAAIQHARGVAVKVLEADPFADAQDCADAIKEAMK